MDSMKIVRHPRDGQDGAVARITMAWGLSNALYRTARSNGRGKIVSTHWPPVGGMVGYAQQQLSRDRLGGRRGVMERTVYAAIVIATAVSVARTVWVVFGFLRTLARPSASVDLKWDWALFLVAPEVVLPAITALWLFYNNGANPPYPFARMLCALLGAGLALGGLALTIWSWLSLPSVGTGHYLLEGQSLVTNGAYGIVRHPIYAGAFLIWFGLAAAYTSGAVLLLTVVYVIPSYVLNIRGEEQMMLSHYGDEYREYRRRVGAFIPRIGRA